MTDDGDFTESSFTDDDYVSSLEEDDDTPSSEQNNDVIDKRLAPHHQQKDTQNVKLPNLPSVEHEDSNLKEKKYLTRNENQLNNNSASSSVHLQNGPLTCLFSSVTGAFYFVSSGARGAVEALVIDVKEVAWWLVRVSLSQQTYTRFQDQWQVFLCGASVEPEDEELEKKRRRRMRGVVRLLGSLLPLQPVTRPYLRYVNLNSLSTSTDSLFAPSVRSLRTPVQDLDNQRQHHQLSAVPRHNRSRHPVSGYSHESGFSTAHGFDSDTSSCLDDVRDGSRRRRADDEDDVTSVYSIRSSQSLAPTKRKPHGKRRHTKRSSKFGPPMNSTENFDVAGSGGGEERGSSLESTLPFTDPAALDKIKSLEDQLEQLKMTVSMMMSQQKNKAPPTPPSSPTSGRRCAPPPPPPPPTPSAPPPPPPPMPSHLLSGSNQGNAAKAGCSLQEMLANKQGNLTKAVVGGQAPKEQPGSWSSVINAIKGGGAKLKKVERRASPKRGSSTSGRSTSTPNDAYRAALTATLRQRFKSVHGSPEREDEETETEYSDSDNLGKGRGKWDSEVWQSPPAKKSSSNFELAINKDRLQKMSPVKLAKDIKNSPDVLLAAVNKKLQSSVVSRDIASNNSLIFVSPQSCQSVKEEEENTVPDSNELFRKFLQSDRKRSSFSVAKKNSVARSTSVPNISPFLRSGSQDDAISTIHEDDSAPVTSSASTTGISTASGSVASLTSPPETQSSAATVEANVSVFKSSPVASQASSVDDKSRVDVGSTPSGAPNTPRPPLPLGQKPRALSFSVESPAQSPFGQHLLKRRTSLLPPKPMAVTSNVKPDVIKDTAQSNSSTVHTESNKIKTCDESKENCANVASEDSNENRGETPTVVCSIESTPSNISLLSGTTNDMAGEHEREQSTETVGKLVSPKCAPAKADLDAASKSPSSSAEVTPSTSNSVKENIINEQ